MVKTEEVSANYESEETYNKNGSVETESVSNNETRPIDKTAQSSMKEAEDSPVNKSNKGYSANKDEHNSANLSKDKVTSQGVKHEP